MKNLAFTSLLSLTLFAGAAHAAGEPAQEGLKFANKHCMAGLCLGQSLEDVASKVKLNFHYKSFTEPSKVSESKCQNSSSETTFLTEQGIMITADFRSFPGYDQFMQKLRLTSIRLTTFGGANEKLTSPQLYELFNSIVARNNLPRPPANGNPERLKSTATGGGVMVLATYLVGIEIKLMMHAPARDTWMLSQPGCGASTAGI